MPEVDKYLTDEQIEAADRQRAVDATITGLDRTPQLGEDGRVRVSDDISAQAIEHGYEPDIQPKAHAAPGVVVGSGAADSAGLALGLVGAGSGLDSTVDDARRLAVSDPAALEELANDSIAKKEAWERLTSPLSMRAEQMVQEAKGELPDLAVVDGALGSVAEQDAAIAEQKDTPPAKNEGSPPPFTPQTTPDPSVPDPGAPQS